SEDIEAEAGEEEEEDEEEEEGWYLSSSEDEDQLSDSDLGVDEWEYGMIFYQRTRMN
ncbi:hypothetical protein A2U01_0035724, partial [Trifolium medium]|nr:hypothetical protein [Trifolium medium]